MRDEADIAVCVANDRFSNSALATKRIKGAGKKGFAAPASQIQSVEENRLLGLRSRFSDVLMQRNKNCPSMADRIHPTTSALLYNLGERHASP
ncbi:MAG: hypothetical protein ABJL99_16975 [Aliishimia sp.]